MGGCVASRIDNEDRVQLFKERRRLMKDLVMYRGEFSGALMAYLRALRNTGATLRQFTESESLEMEDIIIVRQSSPPPTLPPSPPPPPNFSPDASRSSTTPLHRQARENEDEEDSINVDEDDIGSSIGTPHPPIGSSLWNPFETFEDHHHHEAESEQVVDQVEEENWVETMGTHLQEEDDAADNLLVEDDSSSKSMLSWNPPPLRGRTVSWRNNKSLQRIVKDLDDYFLRASALVREVAILMDINSGDAFTPQTNPNNDHKRKSAKVFSALSWSWSSKSLLHLTKESSLDTSSGPSEPCKPGAHCITLAKLFAAEQLLHKEVKEEETVKLEHERKLLMLQRQQEGVEDNRFEKTRLNVETLELQIIFLQESVGRTCSSILSLVDEELYPQLITLTSGLMHMWKTMHECHQVQNHVSLQLKHIINVDQFRDCLSSDYHRKAAVQLESEVQSWYKSFCLLTNSQKEYVKTLCRWVQLTDDSLALTAEDDEQKKLTSEFRKLCEQWLLHLDRVPDNVAAEAIKSLLSSVQSIIFQQAHELDLGKRCEKLEKRLEKESYSLEDMEKRFMCSDSPNNDHKTTSSSSSSPLQLSPRHPLSVKREKIRDLNKVADDEKSKYSNSVHTTKAMVLNNLTTVLPNVFQALIGFTSACIHSLEAIQQINKIQQQQQQEEDETPPASTDLNLS